MIEIVEVSPRDGLQNESTHVSTAGKVSLIRRLLACGLTRLEVASFVHPERVPQMADAEAVVDALPRRDDVSYIGLALNERGARRALDAGVDEVNVVVLASDTFGLKNQGGDRERMIEVFLAAAEVVKAGGLRLSLTVGAAFGCPFEGDVALEDVAAIVDSCLPGRPDEIALADTVGVGVPSQVGALAGMVRSAAPGVRLRFHFHNTRNTGYANAWAAVEAGADSLDASAGGIGGCPFAPRATGNIATEDLSYLLQRSGRGTSVDRRALVGVTTWMQDELGLTTPGLLGKAGDFPGGLGAD